MSGDQERPRLSQSRAREPRPAVHRQHWQSRDGRGIRTRATQAAHFGVSEAKLGFCNVDTELATLG